MPLYDFKCKCGYIAKDIFFLMKDKPKTITCGKCGGKMKSKIYAPNVKTEKDFKPYFHYGLNMKIKSEKQLASEYNKRGLLDGRELLGKVPKEFNESNRRNSKDFDKEITKNSRQICEQYGLMKFTPPDEMPKLSPRVNFGAVANHAVVAPVMPNEKPVEKKRRGRSKK